MFRWLALAVFIACVGLSAYHRRRARREGGVIARSSEGAALIVGRLLVALPLFGGVLIYLVHPAWMEWASLPLPAWGRWLGVGMGLLAILSARWVLVSLGRNVSETVLTKERHELVTTGPYRYVRHPLYTTGIGLFVSIGLMAASGFILLFAAIALVGVRLVVIPREEAELIRAFGDRYRRYAENTGRLLPTLGRRHGTVVE